MGWEALQQRCPRAGIDICADGLTILQLAVQGSMIKALILMCAVSSELRRMILNPAGPHTPQVLRKIGKPIFLSILKEQISNYKHVSATLTKSHPNRTSNEATTKSLPIEI